MRSELPQADVATNHKRAPIALAVAGCIKRQSGPQEYHTDHKRRAVRLPRRAPYTPDDQRSLATYCNRKPAAPHLDADVLRDVRAHVANEAMALSHQPAERADIREGLFRSLVDALSADQQDQAMRRLDDRLAAQGLHRRPAKGDGSCCFLSISILVYQHEDVHQYLRENVCDYIATACKTIFPSLSKFGLFHYSPSRPAEDWRVG